MLLGGFSLSEKAFGFPQPLLFFQVRPLEGPEHMNINKLQKDMIAMSAT